MNLISDVEKEIKALELSKKKLRSFGLMVGAIFLLIAFWIFFTQNQKPPETVDFTFFYLFLFIGSSLFIPGVFSPMFLKPVYRVWMGLAFVMGWFMSRLLIIILFYLVVSTVALIAKLFKKKFLDLAFKDDKSTYWVLRSGSAGINYKKMF